VQLITEIVVNRVHRHMSLDAAQAAVDENHGYKGGAAKHLWESKKWRSLRDLITKAFNPEKGLP
jgi:hypothetical protein